MKTFIASALLITSFSAAFANERSESPVLVPGDSVGIVTVVSDGRPETPSFPGFPAEGVVVIVPISSEGGPEVLVPRPTPKPKPSKNFVYLRCNTTSWNLEEKNLMSPVGEGYSLSYTVKEAWMLDSGESCVLTVTDKKGQWTAKTKEYVAALANGEVATESHSYQTLTRQDAHSDTFRVRYSALGNYTVYFDLKNKLYSVMKLYYHGQ